AQAVVPARAQGLVQASEPASAASERVSERAWVASAPALARGSAVSVQASAQASAVSAPVSERALAVSAPVWVQALAAEPAPAVGLGAPGRATHPDRRRSPSTDSACGRCSEIAAAQARPRPPARRYRQA
ncbi:MAG: hypothetical protein KKC79_11975, partial [Gammaproteobacteria bacterium]|nr:hypothetical protein [Gammaproteobacteria bacterium]